MEKITFIEIETMSGLETIAVIDRGNGEFTSMPKSVWDELQANQNNGGLN